MMVLIGYFVARVGWDAKSLPVNRKFAQCEEFECVYYWK